ncbi:MAG: trans-aconitate 2-methyltransferase [Alphaproteobacteria bacterium]|nr:trans-aconitate 2-methyltransferase [Alphaproteobacteria bacterium]
MAWDPAQYLAFADHRQRPAMDLLARIPLLSPQTVYDLGCGPGTVTRILRRRWPEAIIMGIDGSAAMLERARREAPGVEWIEGDLAVWAPRQPADLIYSNAALHWLDDHEKLFERLIGEVSAGGILAVQMPRNHRAPSHVGMAETIAEGPWAERLARVRSICPVHDPAYYYDILAPHCRELDIWESEYLHLLDGERPVVEWTSGTALKPYLAALDETERADFLARYAGRMARAYPPRRDGRTLFPFRRLFIVATRA